LAYDALRAEGTAPAVLNAANEVAVAAFLDGALAYPAIAKVIADVLEAVPAVGADCIETILDADGAARRAARSSVQLRGGRS
jgi:1-deoxy-D-xylulose-5-phosphate reductoisomerase